MIVLDTNVISELWKKQANKHVLNWLDKQNIETLYLTSITIAELRYGIEVMPKGRKKEELYEHLENELLPVFLERILYFDLKATYAYSSLMVLSRLKGVAVSREDGYIAAIASLNKFIVATRDVTPFEAMELKVINPWNE